MGVKCLIPQSSNPKPKMKCSFCGETIEPGTGKIFVRKTGKVLYFCSNKCEKNMLKLKRRPVDVRWTRDAIQERGGR